MPKVSVIIPVYGVEEYIERCAISLFEQTLDDIEFIFINDCTMDNSIGVLYDVLKRYPDRYKQVKVITHETNGGQARARFTGINNASGDFIIHCDSDDWVDRTLYEKMYNSAITTNSDIVVCDILVNTSNSRNIRTGANTTEVHNFIPDLLFQRNPVSLCNKLIRKDLYHNDIELPTENMGEDMAILLQLVCYCRSMSYVTDVYYYYDGTTPSITRRETKEAILDRALQACRNVELAVRLLKDNNDDVILDGITHLKFMQRKLLMPIINHRDIYPIWQETFPEINKDILIKSSVSIDWSDRLKFFLTLIGLFPIIKEYTRRNIN